MWLIFMVIVILILALGAGVSYFQNRTLNRQLVDSYLGDVAMNIAVSATNEAYHRLYKHTLSPEIDPKVITDWEGLMVTAPGASPPPQTIEPWATRYYFQDPRFASPEYNVEEISDVTMHLVDFAWNVTWGFWSGVFEFHCLVRVRMGAFPAGIAVTRQVRVRKRYYAAQTSAFQSPDITYLEEDVSREIGRSR